MAPLFGQNNLAIFGYGSLLTDPGDKIAHHIIACIPHPSPWPIEYARRAKLSGHGPTLVIHEAGGLVQGKLLVLDVERDGFGEVEEWLWQREGKPPRARIKRMEFNGFARVLYCDLEATLDVAELTAESLARFAIESVHTKPERKGIRYLADNIDRGIVTPLTYAYRDALRLTGAIDLRQAEKILLTENRYRMLFH